MTPERQNSVTTQKAVQAAQSVQDHTPQTINITLPSAGAIENIQVEKGDDVKFAFDQSKSTFERHDNDLTIAVDGGGKVVLKDFFAVGEDNPLPKFTLADGSQIDSGPLLKQLSPGMDISPAAGPAASNATSGDSGIGSYDDGSGHLVDGVDRLGKLGTISWEGGVKPEIAATGAGATLAATNTAGNTAGGNTPPTPPNPTPPTPPAPVDGLHYQARGVLYMAENNQGTDNFSFGVLENAKPTINATNVTIVTASDYAHNYGSSIYDSATGRVTYTLTPEGKAALALLPPSENLYDYITITVDGKPYTMQIVINQNNNFNSADQNTLDAASGLLNTNDHSVIWGEWHSGAKHTDGGTYVVNASHGNNEITYSNGVDSSAGFAGSLTTHEGNDTISISAASDNGRATALRGTLNTGEGTDNLTLNVVTDKFGGDAFGMQNSTVTMGNGDKDTVVISSTTKDVPNSTTWTDPITGNTYTIYYAVGTAMGMDSSSLTLGNGNHDSVNINAVRGYGDPTPNIVGSVGVNDSTISIGDGDYDTLTVTAHTPSEFEAMGVSGSQITVGNGNHDLISISATGRPLNASYATSAQAVADSTINIGGGSDTINIAASASASARAFNNSTLVVGNGGDVINITAEGTYTQGINAARGGTSTVISGTGNDFITISAASNGDSSEAYGMFASGRGHITVDSGAGNDAINITASANGTKSSAYALYAATGSDILVNSGAGDDIINVAATSDKGFAYGVYGNSTIDGGAGNDVINISANGTFAYGAFGGAVIDGGAGNDKITITGTAAAVTGSTVIGGLGSDIITLGDALSGLGGNVAGSTIALGANTAGVDTVDVDDNYLSIYGNVSKSNIYGTDGIDKIYIKAAAGAAMDSSTILTGKGNDSIDLIASNVVTNGNVYGLKSSTVNTGAGDDTINITTDITSSGGLGTGMNASTIDTGSGNNKITITTNASNTAYGLSNNSTIKGGAGNDEVTIAVKAASTGNTTANAVGVLGNGMIDLGDGNNSIDIYAHATSTGVYYANANAQSSGTIKAGDGDNIITIAGLANATASGSYAYAYGVFSSTISTGAGNNNIHLSASAKGSHATAYAVFSNAHISTGDGNDTLTLLSTATSNNDSTAYALASDTMINTGAGNDVISIAAIANTAYGLYTNTNTTSLSSGAGDDTITITVTGNTAYGVYGASSLNRSIVDGGTGNDLISISGTTGSMYFGTVIGGTGSDTINLKGAVNSSTIALGDNTISVGTTGIYDVNRLNITGNASSSKIYGDAGDDRISLSGKVSTTTINAGLGYDILALDLAGITTMAEFNTQYGSLFGAATGFSAAVQGVEHLQIIGTMPSGLDTYLTNHGIDWASVATADANAFIAQTDHTDYNLATSGALAQDINLASMLSNDTVSVGSASGRTIDLGDGWDRVEVHGNLTNSTIKGAAGSGADAGHTNLKEVIVDGTMSDSALTLGAGHDQVHLHSVSNSTINLGAGDDHLYISGNITGSQLHGGTGDDVINLDGVGSIDSKGIAHLNLSDLLSGGGKDNSLEGFERIDLSGNHNNELTIKSADITGNNLGIDTALDSSKFTGADHGLAGQDVLRITGDGHDSVNLGKVGSGDGWQDQHVTVTYDNVTYNHYQDAAHNNILVQQGIITSCGG